MLRSQAQNRAFHSIIGDFARSWQYEGMHLSAAEWKIALVVFFRLSLAEAEGYPIPEAKAPESTAKMDVDRMNNLIEFCYWIGAQIGVEFTE